MKVSDTALQQLHYSIHFNKAGMCGTMPYILFHLADQNFHFRIDPDLEWQMGHLGEFDDKPSVYKSWLGNQAPFDVGDVTFDNYHFTCNKPKLHCDFNLDSKICGGDFNDEFMAFAKQQNSYYFKTVTAPIAPIATNNAHPIPFGADYIPVPDYELSSSPPANAEFWARRQTFIDGDRP